MAAIHDLIRQIAEPALRDRLLAEWDLATKEKKFGLVFENHLPECLPVWSAKPRRNDRVALKSGALNDLWVVKKIQEGQATCERPDRKGEAAQFAVDDLLVVRPFGDPIFPTLVPMGQVQNGAIDAPWHTLIEADNYHALQLLDYLYAGQVDLIYIDPPYNTGARDWKYNNDYVDGNDGWRHSKWLAFMSKRLRLAKRLLKPDIGVLVVTIDEHEVHHLGMLLEAVFPETYRQTVTIVINQKGVEQGRLARAEEYAMYCFNQGVLLSPSFDDLLSPEKETPKRTTVRWERLLRGGNNSRRIDAPRMFYPIYIDPVNKSVTGFGEPIPISESPIVPEDKTVAWPIKGDKSLGNWQVGIETFSTLLSMGYVKVGGYDENRKTWTLLYLNKRTRDRIDSGEILITQKDAMTGVVDLEYAPNQSSLHAIKTVWHRRTHDSGVYGSTLLKTILGEGSKFSFPKSIYATRDAVAAVVRDRPNALVLDFFAGSGTTLNAINLLNATDGGSRRCILVTNNEVSSEEAAALRAEGIRPGEDGWESKGICRSVTWPRSKFTILGRRDDGTVLVGDYLTGRTIEREKGRSFTQIGFVDPLMLDSTAKKKQVVALVDGLPQTLVTGECPFIVSEDHKASILFNPDAAEDWLEALEGQDHITDLYVVTPVKRNFDALKAKAIEILGPLMVPEDEKRPMSDGFEANLAYFRLDFLDHDKVALKQSFREILPLLWLKAGARGPRPECPAGALPRLLIPECNTFAVLLNEAAMPAFVAGLRDRKDLTHLFLVTDDQDAFKDMMAELNDHLGEANPNLAFTQLYRDYLENFLINKGQAEGGMA